MLSSTTPIARSDMIHSSSRRLRALWTCAPAAAANWGRMTMNRYYDEKWSWIEGSHFMRTQLLDLLRDADLAFTPGGDAMTLGALCREMGDVEYSYVQSLKTFQQ